MNSKLFTKMMEKLLLAITCLCFPISLAFEVETEKVKLLEFTIDGEKIPLDLTEIKNNVWSPNMPVWTVESNSEAESGHIFKEVNKKHAILQGTFFEDFESKAVLYATNVNDQLYYDGMYSGHGITTRRIKNHSEILRHSNFSKSEHNQEVLSDFDLDIKDILGKNKFENFTKLSKPLKVLYPKLLLVVESNYFKLFNNNITETVKYLITFWNAINQKYREFVSPKVNIKITGIVIVKDNNALDFINKSRVEKEPEVLDINNIFNYGRDYFQITFGDEVNYKNYDQPILITNLKLLQGDPYVGMALPNDVCLKYIAYIFDQADYLGLFTGAHELGHTLGFSHDNRQDDSKIQSTVMYGGKLLESNNLYWSLKSQIELKEFAKTDNAKCLEYPYRAD